MVSANELYYPYGVDFWNQNGDTASLYNPQGQLVRKHQCIDSITYLFNMVREDQKQNSIFQVSGKNPVYWSDAF